MLALLDEPEEIQNIISRGEKLGSLGTKIGERHVREARGAGLEKQDKTEVLKKAAREGLTSAQTRRVAEAVKEAETPEKKKNLLEHPYEHYYSEKPS